ncbi:SGNH/GDSL hydrolase family protein [Rhabdochromatium marinum]|uniref:SGNH/GDSL hydrolase family protein n=1 Tax=Rhabdochromatium marinum TaxID=48729 RepID=UPI0019076EC5|nr:SGNH/GDSL hydrolase family protein [Rhabdochromatium marinum]
MISHQHADSLFTSTATPGARRLAVSLGLSLLLGTIATATAWADSSAVAVIGDSIGEGVQSADAAWQTQVTSYAAWVATQQGTPLTLPLINTNALGVVGSTRGRHRIEPDLIASNVAVSGAGLSSLLGNRADADRPRAINSETDLVLYPRQQTQLEAIEAAPPQWLLCWIGNNDVLSAVTSFGSLDASQLTPAAEFEADFIALTDRLDALINNHGTRVVFANIPDVTDIAFLLDRAAAEALTGFSLELPAGTLTSLPAALLMRYFGDDALLERPNFVLTQEELEVIQDRIRVLNSIIAREAGRLGMPVVDINAVFKAWVENPISIDGFTLSNQPFGGLFSTDGVHPSNTGHALIANEFIATINQHFGASIAPIDPETLSFVFQTDPYIDKNGDGRIAGRPGVGLLESLALLIGLSGDSRELPASEP